MNLILRRPRSRLMRLELLEAVVQEEIDRQPQGPQTDHEWLEFYEALAQTKLFDHQPDFPAVLNQFRRILDETDPAWLHPPDTFEPDEEMMWRRLYHWRVAHPLDELDYLYKRLHAMQKRASAGAEGFPEAEFLIRNAWYQQHRNRLPSDVFIDHDYKACPQSTVNTAVYQGVDGEYTLSAMKKIKEWQDQFAAEGKA